jgi:CHAD domain-containing protein
MIDGNADEASGGSTARAGNGRTVRKQHPLARRVHDLVGVIRDLGDEPSAHMVHELRTTIRRVETLLPAEEERSKAERKVRKQLGRLRRKAGKLRDVDVHVKALRGVPRTVAPEARKAVRDALEKARGKRQRRLARVVGDERDRGLVKRLRRIIDHAAATPHSDADAAVVVADVLAEFDRRVRAAAPLGAGSLHQLRVATKRLRYRVEPFTPAADAEAVVRELKRVQDAIGAWHDWATLDERIVDVLSDPRGPLVAAVRARTAVELAKATRVTERVAARLRRLAASSGAAHATASGQPRASTTVRKAVRPMTAATVPMSTADASA